MARAGALELMATKAANDNKKAKKERLFPRVIFEHPSPNKGRRTAGPSQIALASELKAGHRDALDTIRHQRR
jgi:hypothetical protein